MASDPTKSASPEERRLLAGRTVPAGLCESCGHLRVLASRRSVFVRCGLAGSDPRFPPYPALPVMECSGYQKV
jgi:hypothetical protein